MEIMETSNIASQQEIQQSTLQLVISKQQPNNGHRSKPPPPSPPPDGVKLAALAIRINASLKLAHMPISMQERALLFSRSLLINALPTDPSSASGRHHRRPSPSLLARSLKKEFDSVYGPAWHCVVGKSFGSFVTHSPGGFLYFSVDSLSFLLFKTEVLLIHD